MRRECLVLVAPANHLFVSASVDPRNQRRQPGEQIGGRRERQQRSAAPLASTAKILSLTSNLALTLPGQMIWVKFGACNGRRCSPSRSNSICEGKNLGGQIYAKEYLRNRSHPFALDNKHNGSRPKRMCRRCQGAVWRRAAGCGPHQGLH